MSEKVYFFKDDQYVQCDLATRSLDTGYPRSVAKDWLGFKDIGFSNITCAAYIPFMEDEFTYEYINFFQGDQGIAYALATSDGAIGEGIRDEGFTISDYCRNIPSDFDRDWDAAMPVYASPPTQLLELHVFKGPKMAVASPCEIGSVFKPPIISNGLPDPFSSGVDTGLSLPNNDKSWFKGDQVYLSSGSTVSITSRWKGLDDVGFDRDIQAALYLPVEKPTYK